MVCFPDLLLIRAVAECQGNKVRLLVGGLLRDVIAVVFKFHMGHSARFLGRSLFACVTAGTAAMARVWSSFTRIVRYFVFLLDG